MCITAIRSISCVKCKNHAVDKHTNKTAEVVFISAYTNKHNFLFFKKYS